MYKNSFLAPISNDGVFAYWTQADPALVHTHFWLPILILGALQNVVDDPASGGVGEERVPVVDSEAEEEGQSMCYL